MPKLIESHYKYSQEGLTLDVQEEISQKKLIIKNHERNEIKICVGSNKIITKNLNFTKYKSLKEFLVKINSN